MILEITARVQNSKHEASGGLPYVARVGIAVTNTTEVHLDL
jgi:hypothetical protein